MNRGFSLVELSIVLVILGLLTGGILAGQSLIRAAELRAVSTEYNRWVTATQTFRDKYFSLPGDMRNATSFWGAQSGATNCVNNAGTTAVSTGTCDGDGNGWLSNATAASATAETFQYWRQLAAAGLVEGSYTGLAGPTSCCSGLYIHAVQNTNVPNAKLSSGGWSAGGASTYSAGNAAQFAGNIGNYFFLGGFVNGGPSWTAIVKPEEIWNVDTKMDDGMPATGKVWAYNWSTCTNASSQTNSTATYTLTTTSNACTFMFPQAF